jgi:hypothetical protein
MIKEELHKIIDTLPDSKLNSALSLLQVLRDDKPEYPDAEPIEETDNGEPLNRFLADLVGSISAVFYDLANEAGKKNDPILENRLIFSRKKITNSWDKYKVKSKRISKK